MKQEHNKPVIETLINTTALALTATGTSICISERGYYGFILIAFGAGLEYFKYLGRQRKLW